MTEQDYQQKSIQLQKYIDRLKQKSRLYLIIKLTAFACAMFALYETYHHTTANNLLLIAAAATVYVAFCVIDDRCIGKIYWLKRSNEVCQKEMEYLKGIYTRFDEGNEYIDPQHEYTFDLDIFGKDSLFQRINRTVSRSGSQRLANKLSHLSNDVQEITDNREAITELATMNDWRIDFMANTYIDAEAESLSQYAGKHRFKHVLFTSMLPFVIVGITLTFALLAIMDVASWMPFNLMFMLQLFVALMLSKLSNQASADTGKMEQHYRHYLKLINAIHQAHFKSAKLKRIKAALFSNHADSLKAFGELSRLLNMFSQSNGVVLYVLLNGCILFDVLLIRWFIGWNRRYGHHLHLWMDCVAEIDALVSMANYAANHPENHQAEVAESGSSLIIEAKQMYHPFLKQAKAVPNDFCLSTQDIAIVTGANMAGKSTFLRTLGVTYIMACNGMPVCAQQFRFRTVTLFSSMRTSDSLSKDISYFNAELLRLKQLIAHVKSNEYTLIILDEILKGTNSKDKLEGSIMFLKEISRYNVSAIIATHDLELARLEEEDSQTYHNYCFEIELTDEIKYSYKIARGMAKNLNASFLLANILKSLQ